MFSQTVIESTKAGLRDADEIAQMPLSVADKRDDFIAMCSPISMESCLC